MKSILINWPYDSIMRQQNRPASTYSEIYLKRIVPTVCYFFLRHILYNRNLTMHQFAARQELVIEKVSRYPPENPDLPTRNRLSLKNRFGQDFVNCATISWANTIKYALRAKIRSDFLSIELHKRLGMECVLADPYTGHAYLVDAKTGKPFSAGPDGQSGTKDDIGQ